MFLYILLQSHLAWPSPPRTHTKWQSCIVRNGQMRWTQDVNAHAMWEMIVQGR